jgi:two-component system, NarL family, sensor kinase
MEGETALIFFVIVFSSILILIILIIFIYKITKLHNKRQSEYLDNINILNLKRENELLETRIQVQESTFQTISREIHDNINQILTLSKLNLNSIDFNNIYDSEFKIRTSLQLTTEAIQSLTNLSKALNADLIKDLGISRVLGEEIQRINLIKASKIEYDFDERVDDISPEYQLILFRVSQEAIRNSIIHGQSANIKITLSVKNDQVYFEIRDDGSGFDVNSLKEKKFSQGLKNIEDRIKGINGTYQLMSRVGEGTSIIITFHPLQHQKINR